jgi:hypothetical protein
LAATLGVERVEVFPTLKRVVTLFFETERRNPVGVEFPTTLSPRVAAKRGNPGLYYITALR